MTDVCEELKRWLETNWDPDLGLLEWRTRLVDAGWACPTWPTEWGGRGLPVALAETITQTLADFGVPGPPESVGMHLAVPTLLEHGSDDLKSRFLRPTATGEIVWCQLFSEPGAGSDLAGLTTRAELDGDEWVVSGQKVWNTGSSTGRLRDTPRPHRLGCSQASGNYLFRPPYASKRRRCPSAPADERPLLVQRGVPRRSSGAREQCRWRSGTWMAGGTYHACS